MYTYIKNRNRKRTSRNLIFFEKKMTEFHLRKLSSFLYLSKKEKFSKYLFSNKISIQKIKVFVSIQKRNYPNFCRSHPIFCITRPNPDLKLILTLNPHLFEWINLNCAFPLQQPCLTRPPATSTTSSTSSSASSTRSPRSQCPWTRPSTSASSTTWTASTRIRRRAKWSSWTMPCAAASSTPRSSRTRYLLFA